jgi:CheY-like chemotaxis protein
MPVMNGWEFLGEVSRAPSLSTIPVVILTAADRVEMPPGAKALLRKPVDFRSLIEAVERHASGGDAAPG